MGYLFFFKQKTAYELSISLVGSEMCIGAKLRAGATRALAEAEGRKATAQAQDLPRELGGRDGLEPVRFGDWERKGIAVDF